jgi:hypothetical protein
MTQRPELVLASSASPVSGMVLHAPHHDFPENPAPAFISNCPTYWIDNE